MSNIKLFILTRFLRQVRNGNRMNIDQLCAYSMRLENKGYEDVEAKKLSLQEFGGSSRIL